MADEVRTAGGVADAFEHYLTARSGLRDAYHVVHGVDTRKGRADLTEADLRTAIAHLRALSEFAREIIRMGWECDLDGSDIQDLAVKHGLLKPQTMEKPCGDNCACNDVGDFPTECFRFTIIAQPCGSTEPCVITHTHMEEGCTRHSASDPACVLNTPR